MIVKSINHDLPMPDYDLDDVEVVVEDRMGEGGIPGLDPMDDPGGMDLLLGENGFEEEPLPEPPFDANLAGYLDDDQLGELATDLIAQRESDKQSRAEWERIYTDGLDLLGIKIEDRDFPWEHACGVTHPMILESAVRFQSKASVRLFPSKGPAAVRVFGRQDDETMDAARRVEDDLNYYCLEKIPEYFSDTEQLLFALAVSGSAFRKLYYDPSLKRPCATFVAAADFFMPAGFPHLASCPRYTQRMRLGRAEVKRLMVAGYYRDVDLGATGTPEQTDAEQKEDSITGITPSADHNELVVLYEMHTDLDLPGFESEDGVPLPFVITWEESTSEILGIYRNWREDDPQRRKTLSFEHYRYVPGLDNYGWGLIHLIGGISKSSTSILRQLVDAGTLANLSGGLKARSLRIKVGDTPIAPGEWRDVDIPSGKIADSLYPLPYKEPSATLLALYNNLVQEGKEFASIADLDMSASAANAPVGTMLAMIERASEVITAVQARLHATFKGELNLLASIIRRYDSAAYDYPPATGKAEDKQADYARAWSIRPSSDPSAATTAQRVMQYQAAMQFSAQAPQIYDIPKLHREMLANLGIDPPEDLVPDKQARPMDPVSENMAALNAKPIRAFEYQDHEAHLGSHMPFIQDQELQGMLSQSPTGAAVNGAMAAHIAEHVAFNYRRQIEKQLGTPLPPLGEPLPPEVENQIAQLEAQASAKLGQQRAADAQQKKADEQNADPMYQLEQARVQNEVKRIDEVSRAAQAKEQLASRKLDLEQQQNQARLMVTAQSQQADQQIDQGKLAIDQQKADQAGEYNVAHLELENEKLRTEVLKIRGELEIERQRLALMSAQRTPGGGNG